MSNATEENASRIHERTIVIDAHADIEIPGRESPYVGPDGRSRVAPDKMKRGSVDAVVMSVAVGPGDRSEEGYLKSRRLANKKMSAVKSLIEDSSNNLKQARSAQDVEHNKGLGKRSVILGFQNAEIIGRSLDDLVFFREVGVCVFALNHIGHNEFADSSRPNFITAEAKHEPTVEHGGLSDLGRAAVKKLNELGGLIDVSQSSKSATLQTIEVSKSPIIASHSNVWSLCDVSRNLSDEEIDAIAHNGGVIHITPFRGYLYDSNDSKLVDAIREARVNANLPVEYQYPFELYWEIKDPDEKNAFRNTISSLLGEGSLDVFIDHIKYVADRVGIGHVGIGTDFNQGGGIRDFNEASDAPKVTTALLARGFSEQDIDKIWGRNFLRVLSEAQGR